MQGLLAFYRKVRSGEPSTVTGLPVGLRLLKSLIALSQARARADLRQVQLPVLSAHIACYMCSSLGQLYEERTIVSPLWLFSTSVCFCNQKSPAADGLAVLRQGVLLADAEDAIALIEESLFGGSAEEAAVVDFRRPAAGGRKSKQVSFCNWVMY